MKSSLRNTVFTSLLASAWLLSAVSARAALPVINTQPASITNVAGTTASFTVSATGTPAPTYRWRKNGTIFTSPSASPTLTLNNVSDSDAASYTVLVNNSFGTVTSTPAVLTVIHPPVITAQPDGVVVLNDDEAFFTVGVNSPTDLSYQWKFNGTDLPGETGSILDIISIAPADAGIYSVFVTNIDGNITSAGARLTVLEPAIVQSLPNPVNTCATITLNVVTYGSDTLHYQWYEGDTAVGTDSASLIIPGVTFADGTNFSVVVSNPGGFTATATGSLIVQDPFPVITGIPANITTNTGAGNLFCSQVVKWIEPGVSDNCAGVNMTSNFPSGSAFPVGITTVAYIATDSIGQRVTNSFTVTVTDTTPPVAAFNHISVQLDNAGIYSLTPANIAAITAGSGDACGLAGTNINQTTFSFCDVGTPVIGLTLTDIHGNTTATNSTITVLAPTNVPSVVYVDAGYGACSGSVTFPQSGGTGSYYIGYNAFSSIQSAVAAVTAGGTVNVTAGTYGGVTVGKAVTLVGANAGVAANGVRGPESIVSVGAGATAVNITADNVTVDGFTLQGGVGSTGLNDNGHANVVVQNNIVSAGLFGLSLQNIAGPLVVQNNSVNLTAQEIAGNPTVGVVLAGISGSGAVIRNNNLAGALYGYLLADVNATSPLRITGGTITGVMQGVAVVNYNLAFSAQKASAFVVDGVSMSGFAGTSANAGRNLRAGVYVFTGGADTTATVTGTITNVTVTGTGNIGADTAGLDLADFSTGAGVRQQITVVNSHISTNENRGIFISGKNAAATVTGSEILGNGFDPYTASGNHGFGIIARNNAQLTVSECYVANPAVQVASTVSAVDGDANTNPEGPTVVVTDCSIVNNGNVNGKLVSQSAGTVTVAGNWWGTTSDTTISGLMNGVVDFTPYLDSGADTSLAAGFQGDFGTVDVSALQTQGGGIGRVQEGINTVTAGGTVKIQAGTFNEGPQIVINKNVVVVGTALASTIIKPTGDTAIYGSGSTEGWWLVTATHSLNLSGLTLDGTGHLISSGIYTLGDLTVSSARFTGIGYLPSTEYDGQGITAHGSATVNVTDSAFDNMGRIGIFLKDPNVVANIFNSTFTGKGNGDWLDYAIEVSKGAHATITGNVISGNTGVASSDGSTSGGILVTTYYGPGTTATITGCTLQGNTDGIDVGYDGSDSSTVVAHNNDLSGNSDAGIFNTSSSASVDAAQNWWGNLSGPASGTANPYGTGSGIVGPATISPWLGDGTDTQPAVPGFQPNSSPAYTPPTHMVFTIQPGNALLNHALAPQPVLTIEDANDNVTPWANPNISLTIAANPTGSGILAGTTIQTAVNGVATFNNVAIAISGGNGYTLAAADSLVALPVVISTLFTVTNPVPVITQLNPNYALAGGSGFSLTITGTNFVPGSVVDWNGSARSTTYVSGTQLTAAILSSDITSVGLASVAVVNPNPGGSVSAPAAFNINPAVPLVVFVDTNYAALPTSTAVNWPYTGTGTNIIGYDAFGSIQAAVDAVALSGAVKVAAGTFHERVVVAKPGVSVSGSGAGTIVDGTTSLPAPGVTPSVFKVATNDVTIQGFQILVNFAFNHSGVHSSGKCTGMTVANNTIIASASPAPAFGYGLRNAIAVNPNIIVTGYTFDTGYNGVVVTGNTIQGTGGTVFFRAGIQMDVCGGVVSSNISTTINHDFITRFASQGDITVSGNSFYGGGAQFGSFNAGVGTVTITNNLFDNSILQPATGPIGTGASLRLSYYAEGTTVNNSVIVAGNTFQNHRWAVSVEDYKNVTFDNNTFTPKAGSTDYVHMTFNTKIITSTSASAINMFPVGATLTRNTFNGSGAAGGTALAFYNHRGTDAVFGNYVLGTPGNENNFNAGVASFIKLDNSTGSSAGWAGFSEYAGIPATAMAPWSANLDASNNKFDVGSGLTAASAMSLTDLFATEDRIQDQLDDSALGFVRLKAASVLVSAASGSIQRGINAATPGDTLYVSDGSFPGSVTINKALSMVSANGALGTTITGDSQTAVTIAADNVAVRGFTVKNPNNKWGINADNQSHLLIAENRVIDIGLNDPSALESLGIGIASYGASAVDDVRIVGNLVSNILSSAKSGEGIVAGYSTGTGDITGLVIASNRITQVTSSLKGAYGILLNHATSPTGGKTIAPQLLANDISYLNGKWAHAVGLEGDTPNALVSGNSISAITAANPDAVGVQVEDNAQASTVLIANNSFSGVLYGVQNVTGLPVSAPNNWWSSVSGPVNAANPGASGIPAVGNVSVSPWLASGGDTSGTIGFQPDLSQVYYQPDHLTFSTQPVGAGINTVLTSQPVVRVIDSNGGIATIFNGSVSVAINTGTAGATLSGGLLTVPVVAGVATFSGFQIDRAGTYTLVASSSSPIVSAISSAFDISNSLPAITSVNPAWAVAGDPGFTLTVTGSNYVYNSVIRWNGSALPTTYVSSTQLSAPITDAMIVAVSTASVTVFNVAPGGGESTPATSFPIYVRPPVVYVNGAYSSNGANDGHLWGYDAFTTVQAGIDRVNDGGTVNVAAGGYTQDLVIDHPLALIGPNAGINPNTGVRNPEAILRPSSADPNPYNSTETIVVYVTASHVTIKGFTVDGNNPAHTSGVLVGGVDTEAGEGIVSYEGVGSITIADNIVKNTTYTGVDFDNYTDGGIPSTGNQITENLFTNLGETTYQYGIGVVIYDNFYAEISSNVMSEVRLGVQTGNYYRQNPGAAQYQTIHDNIILCGRTGIFHNLAYGDASTYTLSNNVITAWQEPGFETVNRQWDGIALSSIQQNISALAINNVIDASAAITNTSGIKSGYSVWYTPTAASVLIAGGSISNASYGVWVNNYTGYNLAAVSTHATVSGVNITGSTIAGVYVQNDIRGVSGSIVSAVITDNTGIHGSPVGVLVFGTNTLNATATILDNAASITGNVVGIDVNNGKARIQGNDLAGNTVAAIRVEGGSIVDAGNCGSDVTGLGTSTGGNNLSGYGFNNAAPWAIQNLNSGGTPSVLAEHNNFGAIAGDNIPAAFSGPVVYSQTPAVIVPPSNVTVVCVSDVPAGVNTLSGFIALGGYFSADSAIVNFVDQTNLNGGPVGSGTITRTYTLTDHCSVGTVAVQTITVSDTEAPSFTLVPGNLTYNADAGQCSKSNVTWTVTAGDNCGVASLISVPPSGSTFPKGVTTVTNIVTDYSGNTATNLFTVTVNDIQPPLFVVGATNQTVVADDTAHALLPNLTLQVVVSDNCGSVILSQQPAANTVVGLGTYPVTVTVVDQSGNTNTSTASVSVVDRTMPGLNLPVNVTVTTLQSKDPYATGVATASDAGGTVMISYDDNRGGLADCDTTGVILRTWTATDPFNNTTNGVQIITVIDTNTPYFTYLPANITVTNEVGQCAAVVAYAPTAMDLGYSQDFENAAYVSGAASNNPSTDWNDFNSHITRVTSVTDGIVSPAGVAHGVIDSSTAALDDTTGAFSRLGGYSRAFGTGYRVAQDVYIDLNDPAVLAATLTSGYAWDLSAAVNDQAGNNLRDFIFHAAAYDSTGVVIGAGNNSNNSIHDRGDDLRAGAHATITQTGWYHFEWVFRNTNDVLAVDLKVRDTSGAVLFSQTLSSPGDTISTVVGGHRYLWFTFIAADKLAIDNTLLERIIPVNTTIPSGASFPVGTLTVTNTITDVCGNSSNATFNVTVNDVEAPSANVPGPIVQNNDAGQCGAIVNFTLPPQTDNCRLAATNVTPASGSHFPVGTTLVTVVITDIHLNSTTNTFNVTVNDVEAPSANVPGPIVQNNDAGQCGAIVNFTLPVQTDNCGLAATNVTPASGSHFPVGTTPVTVVITDIHLNSTTNTFNVTVNDAEAPTVIPPANIVQGVDAGQNYATVHFSVPAGADNCGVSNVVATPASGSQFPVGTNTVTLVVTDIHGNTNSATFTVAVIALPNIVSNPASRTNNAGTTATFTVLATSPAPLTYQWFKGSSPLSNGDNISGATNATLSIANVQDADVAGYKVEVSNLAGTVTSSTATLTVINPPVITNISPANRTNNATTTAVFTVSVTGTAPFSYQWTKITPAATNVLVDGGNISGATSNVLTINNVLAVDQATYVVTASNPAATVATNAILVVVDPVIFVQPVDVSQALGGNATFTVTAAGTAALHYQWQQDGFDLPGATSSTLLLSNIQDSDGGDYTVVVYNDAGEATSEAATLTITHPPVIITQPADLTVNQGNTATFTVSANGTAPFTYQWRKNGVPLLGETAKKLVLTAVTPANEGSYDVAITNADGNILSGHATLTVIVPPAITVQPLGLTNNPGTTAIFSAIASGTAPAYQWFKNGTNALSNGGNISGATSNVLTLLNVYGAASGSYSLVASNQAGVAISSNAILMVIDPFITSQPVSLTVNLGQPASFSVGVDGTAPQYQWRQDGANISGATAATYSLAHAADSDRGAYSVVVTTAYGSVTSSPAATLTVIDPPSIVTQPLSRTNNAGTTATFTVSATGTAPSYQWYKGVTLLTGETAPTLTLPNVQQVDATSYSVVLSNAAGVVTSSSATLTVIDAPSIVTQPLSRTNNAGTTATFTVSATGTAPSYQWYKGVTLLTGETAPTLTLPNVQQVDATAYSVVLSNAAGVVTSSSATLTVIDAPSIVTQPLSRTNNAGTTATFTVSATGTAPSYQWYKGVTPISGAITATLTLPNVQQVDATSYSVVLSNAAGVVTSSSATLTVIDAPVIVTQPLSRTNNATTTATFSVSANGTAPFAYRWYKAKAGVTNLLSDVGNVSGSTGNLLTITNVLAADQASYSVTISNAAGIVTSADASLVVTDPVITVQPVGVTNIVGSTVSFTVTAVGTAALHYQWRQDGAPLFGETNSTLTLVNIANSDSGDYTVVVTNLTGSATSVAAKLVSIPPLITSQPADLTIPQNSAASFSVSVSGQAPFSYQWQYNNANISGATNRIFSLAHALQADTGGYRVIVTNPLGVQTSRTAALLVYTSTVPVMTISCDANMVAMAVTLTGVPGLTYAIQSSTNLSVWTTARTNASPFTLTETNGTAKRFYRGLYLP